MDVPPVVLTIAGFDPCSGAGVTADIKTIAAHGCYGVACITALTVQSTVAVRELLPTPGTVVRHTLHELAADLPISAIHIGMLGSGEVAEAVADFLGDLAGAAPAVVLDPVLRSSSGAELLDSSGNEVLRSRLLPLATVVTPNMGEASALAGYSVETVEDMHRAAHRLHLLGAKAVVVTGGHLEGNETLELLSQISGGSGGEGCLGVAESKAERICEFRGAKLNSRATHGTGCAFASALACNLALGSSLADAVPAAKRYVVDAIGHAYPLGHGHGPLNHLWRLSR